MLAKSNSFQIRYGFIHRALNINKPNIIALKMIIISSSHAHIFKK